MELLTNRTEAAAVDGYFLLPTENIFVPVCLWTPGCTLITVFWCALGFPVGGTMQITVESNINVAAALYSVCWECHLLSECLQCMTCVVAGVCTDVQRGSRHRLVVVVDAVVAAAWRWATTERSQSRSASAFGCQQTLSHQQGNEMFVYLGPDAPPSVNSDRQLAYCYRRDSGRSHDTSSNRSVGKWSLNLRSNAISPTRQWNFIFT